MLPDFKTFPTALPVGAAAAGGALPAGAYALAYTFATALGETTTSPVVNVVLAANQQIAVTGVAPPAWAAYTNWYLIAAPAGVTLGRVAQRVDGTNFNVNAGGTAAQQPPNPATLGGFPETTGYANVADVQANINAGTWDPTKPGATPSSAQVQDMLKTATAQINLGLRTRGYYVPLRGQAGWPAPPYMSASDLVQGIMPEVWMELRWVAAAFAVHRVLMTRATPQRSPDHALEWLHIFDDFMTRLESGADNLYIMGVDGDFAPLADDAQGLGSGELDPSTSTNADPLDPSTWMNTGDTTPQGIFSTTEGVNPF